MISNIKVEGLTLGKDEEFNRRSNASFHELLELILFFIRLIYRFSCGCWSYIKFYSSCFKYLFIKRYIAVTVLLLSFSCLTTAIITVRGMKRLIFVMYSFSIFVCSLISISFKKGAIMFVSLSERMEQQQHLIDTQDFQEVDQPAKDDTEDEKELLHKALKNLMKTKSETETTSVERRTLQVPYDFHHSDSYTPLNCIDFNIAGPSQTPDPFTPLNYDHDCSAGPSQTPDPFTPLNYDHDCSAGPSQAPDPFPPLNYNHDCSAESSHAPEKFPLLNQNDDSSTRAFNVPDSDLPSTCNTTEISVVMFENTTNFVTFADDSYNSNELPQRLSVARISADAIKAFGTPVQVLGADSYRVLDSNDEICASYTPALSLDSSEARNTDVEEKTFEAFIEVYHSDSYRSLSSNNNDSSSTELDSMAIDENVRMSVSDSQCSLPYADEDQ